MGSVVVKVVKGVNGPESPIEDIKDSENLTPRHHVSNRSEGTQDQPGVRGTKWYITPRRGM